MCNWWNYRLMFKSKHGRQKLVEAKLIPWRVHLVCLRKCKSKQKLLYYDSNYLLLSYFENISFEVYGWIATFMRKTNEWFIFFDMCQFVDKIIGKQIYKNVWNCCLESMSIESVERIYYHSEVFIQCALGYLSNQSFSHI